MSSMSSARDLFIMSVYALKNRPKMLRELEREVERQKKSGDLKAEDCDRILDEVRRVKTYELPRC